MSQQQTISVKKGDTVYFLNEVAIVSEVENDRILIKREHGYTRLRGSGGSDNGVLFTVKTKMAGPDGSTLTLDVKKTNTGMYLWISQEVKIGWNVLLTIAKEDGSTMTYPQNGWGPLPQDIDQIITELPQRHAYMTTPTFTHVFGHK